MDREGIKTILRELQGPNVELVDRGEWVSTHCPLAPWTHEKGTDRHISFGVHVNPYGESVFNCYSCKSKGTLSSLIRRMEHYTGDDYSWLLEEVEDNEVLGGSLPKWEDKKKLNTRTQLPEPLPLDYLDIYEPAEGHWYLRKRKISDDVVRKANIKIDPDNKGVERVLFPVFSPDGRLCGFSGRATRPGAEPRVRDYFGLPKRLLLLGAEKINPKEDKFVLLVEGLFDYARLLGYGYPVVASMHSTLTKQQAEILRQFSLPVYCFFDNDLAGKKGTKVAAKMLAHHIPIMKVRYPKGVKDPDELLEDEVEYMIKDARIL